MSSEVEMTNRNLQNNECLRFSRLSFFLHLPPRGREDSTRAHGKLFCTLVVLPGLIASSVLEAGFAATSASILA